MILAPPRADLRLGHSQCARRNGFGVNTVESHCRSPEPQASAERFGIATPEIIMRPVALGFLCLVSAVSPSFAQGHMGTPQEQQACSRDAQRFCRHQLNDDFAVQQCLQQNRARLSRSCQRVFASHGM